MDAPSLDTWSTTAALVAGHRAAGATRSSPTALEQRVSLEDYSVSNRGLKSGLGGTSEQVAERILEFERAGLDLLLLLQFSPHL